MEQRGNHSAMESNITQRRYLSVWGWTTGAPRGLHKSLASTYLSHEEREGRRSGQARIAPSSSRVAEHPPQVSAYRTTSSRTCPLALANLKFCSEGPLSPAAESHVNVAKTRGFSVAKPPWSE